MYKIKLSPYHKIFYNEWKLNPVSYKYNLVFDQIIQSNLVVSKLKLALQRFIAENIIFNSHIQKFDEEFYWVENSTISELEHYTDNHNYIQILEYISKPFNLENGCLYRFALFNMQDNNYRFIIVLHHILLDGNSFDNLITEISNYYNDGKYKLKFTIKNQVDSVQLMTDKLDAQLKFYSEKSNSFWYNQLLNVEPVDITFMKPYLSLTPQQSKIKEIGFHIRKNLYSKISRLYNNYKLSAYSYSQMIFAILLYRYNSQNKFAISYPISIKGCHGLTCGAQINTSLFPYNINECTTILDLITQTISFIHAIKIDNFNYGYYPINNIIANTKTNYLNVSFTQTNLKSKKFSFKDAKTIKVNHEYNIDLTTQLTFEQAIVNQTLCFRVKYYSTEIDETILKQFIAHYKKLFYDILKDLNQGLDNKLVINYPILNDDEYKQITQKWNRTYKRYPVGKTIQQLFEEQAVKTPNNIAIVNQSTQLSYIELNEKANQLAYYLRSVYKIQGDDLIVFCLERSEHTIITLLAILKAGGAYVPVNTSYPDDRIIYILQNTKAKLIITEELYKNRFKKLLALMPPITHINLELINHLQYKYAARNNTANNLSKTITSNNLAYVIYTSGTTGNPKGVMVEHKSVINYISNIKDKVFNGTVKHVDFSTNIGFDLTVTAILGTLCCGYQIHIYNGDLKDLNNYKNHLLKSKINIIKLSPSYFELLLDILPTTRIDTIILGGEKVSPTILYKICKSNLTIYDEYGPTEATVGACLSRIYAYKSTNDKLHIGTPYHNYKIYILDNQLGVLPIGAIGELYIGGIGLARGYLNQPELSTQKFIPNPFQTKTEKLLKKNGILYKTGDLARYLADGNIEYVGRVDLQVKLRGYRIELTEIEAVINTYPEIKQSVVTTIRLVADNQISVNTCLIGYYVSDYKLDESLLLDYLFTRLPEYMIPSAFIHLASMPLTINGKLDRGSLPSPQLTLQNKYIAPSSDLEREICTIYSEILHLNKNEVGTGHDFFNIGGNSILAICLTHKLQKKFQITVNDIFKLRTPAKIAQFAQLIQSKLIQDKPSNRLQQIKLIYNKLSNIAEDSQKMRNKQKQYLQEIKHIKVNNEVKKIKSVLLTGATGHLGSHILYQLLSTTTYKIYLLVRAPSNIYAYIRLNDKFKFYFNSQLDPYLNRIVIFTADLEKPNLNLTTKQYQQLITNVDSIIHAAASVKHYGDYNNLYQANVVATINLLELAKLTALKDFHYISTLSVLTNGYVANSNYYIFTENDNNINLENDINIYSKTKYEGELATIQYRQFGVNGSIYRVGNLSINSQTHINQENINENAFFVTVSTFLNLGIIPEELSHIEISPVDYTASAIVTLFNKSSINNQTYHIANKYKSNLFELLQNKNVRMVTLDNFINTIFAKLNDNTINKQIELFMLHQGWLEKIDTKNLTKIIILQNKTDWILNRFGFNWIPITDIMFSDVINKSISNKI